MADDNEMWKGFRCRNCNALTKHIMRDSGGVIRVRWFCDLCDRFIKFDKTYRRKDDNVRSFSKK